MMRNYLRTYAGSLPDGTSRDEVIAHYRNHEFRRTIFFSRLGAILAFILIPIFMLLDLYVFMAPREFFYFRVVPLVPALALLVFLRTPLARRKALMKTLYLVFLLSLMIMMCGIVAMAAKTGYYEATMLGLLIVIFAVFIGFRGSIATLAAILLLPVIALTVYTGLDPSVTAVRIVFMATPYAEVFIVIIIAISQKRMRQEQFLQRSIIESQNRELQKNNRLIEEKNAQMSADLLLARSIQNGLIPLDPPAVIGVSFHPAYLPVDELGGDMYDFLPAGDDGRTGVFISDVSGHGVLAALISAMVKTLVHNAGPERGSCDTFLSYLDSRLSGLTGNNFVTALYGIYDPATRVLHYARAGHPYPCLLGADGGVRELRSGGRFLGAMPGFHAEVQSVGLAPGDKVLFYTDGLVEAENAHGDMFREILFGDILPRMAIVPARTMIGTIIEDLFRFSDGGRISDDICMVCMEVGR